MLLQTRAADEEEQPDVLVRALPVPGLSRPKKVHRFNASNAAGRVWSFAGAFTARRERTEFSKTKPTGASRGRTGTGELTGWRTELGSLAVEEREGARRRLQPRNAVT